MRQAAFLLSKNMQSWLNWYSSGSDAKLVPVGEKPTFLTDIWVRIPGSALKIRGVIGSTAVSKTVSPGSSPGGSVE